MGFSASNTRGVTVKPMTSLLEKRKEFDWTWECQESFNQLRFKLMLALVLIMPDL
jgi:hypothetical protein